MFRVISLILSTIILSSCSTGSKTSAPETGGIQIPKYENVVLDNGISVYFMQDLSLPIFTVQGMLSKGSADDFEGKSGVAALMVSMLKEGSAGLSSEQYKDAYSKYSSDFDVNVDKDSVHFKSSGLSKYGPEISKLFLNTLFQPNFVSPQKSSESIKEYDKVRAKRQAQIVKSMEEASYFASISYGAQLFGKNSYGMPEWGTASGIKKTLLADVQAFYKQNMQPSNLQFALSGNYSDDMKAELLKSLNAIKSSSTDSKAKVESVVASSPGKPDFKTKIVVIDKPNLKQAEVRMGHFGPSRTSKDFIPLYIANSVVGSGDFSSQLMQEIRVKRGLVYGINAGFVGYKDAGAFVVSSSTRHEKVPELITTTLDILKSSAAKGLDAKQLEIQKGILSGQFPLKFETDDSFLQQLMKYNTFGFDKDYIKRFYEKIKTLDIVEANQVLKTYYKPDDVLIVIFASKNQLPKSIKDLGRPVEYIDYRKVF